MQIYQSKANSNEKIVFGKIGHLGWKVEFSLFIIIIYYYFK